MTRIAVIGGEGFIARNLRVRLRELGYQEVASITRSTTDLELAEALPATDLVYHLAGVNRPRTEGEFTTGNIDLTARVCRILAASGRRIPVIYASSTQAALDNPYGRSKLAAEQVLRRYGDTTGATVLIFRLTNVFGKWCKPHYNSVVATFCHQLARGEQIAINDASQILRLVYIDDVIDAFVQCLKAEESSRPPDHPGPVYETTLGELASTLQEFARRRSLTIGRVGRGFQRALYATYISYLPPPAFSYEVPQYRDSRGVFVEMMKTPDSGQFSYFIAKPGITRGQHYHHTKVEQFLVIQGTAHFRFRNIDSGEIFELVVHGREGRVVFSIPGWAHDVTNTGSDELVVMLWASENFEQARPDTVLAKVIS